MPLDTRISLYKLEVLCAVVEAGGVTRAADQLFLSQPVVTTHIRSLEQRLGVRLFERSGRGIEPTEAGQVIYEWACEIISRSHDMSRKLDCIIDGSGGSAVIAAGMTAGTFILPKLLVDFYRDSPDAHITLTQQAPERALEVVSVGDADLAIVLGAEQELTLMPASLQRERLRDEELVLVASPNDGGPVRVQVEELSDLRFVCSPEPGSLRRAVIDQKLEEVGAPPRDVVLALDHPTAIKTCVKEGIGVALLFRSAVERELEEGSLRAIEMPGIKLSIPLYLVYRRDKRFPPLQRRLVSYFQECLAASTEELDIELPIPSGASVLKEPVSPL